MAVVSYVSWKTGRAGFGLYHMTRDNAYTLCGRQPDGRITIWQQFKSPPVELTCGTCRERFSREEEIK